MYDILCDGKVIYNSGPNVPSEITLINPKLVLKDCEAGSLTFSCRKDTLAYDKIKLMQSIISVERDGKEIWFGRALGMSTNFNQVVTYTCEGALAFLNDVNARQGSVKSKNYLKRLLTTYNMRVKNTPEGIQEKKLYFKKSQINNLTPNNPNHIYEPNFETIASLLISYLKEQQWHYSMKRTADGKISFRIKDTWNDVAEQTVELGKNLLDYTDNYTMDKLATVILPLGHADERYKYGYVDLVGFNYNTLRMSWDDATDATKWCRQFAGYEGKRFKTIQDAELWVSAHHIQTRWPERSRIMKNSRIFNDYGYIEKVVHFPAKKNPNDLRKRAKKYLRTHQFDKMTISMNIMDLGMYGINQNGTSEIPFDLCDVVHITAEPFGLDGYFPITKMEIPLYNPIATSYTFGHMLDTDDVSDDEDVDNDYYTEFTPVTELSHFASLAEAYPNVEEYTDTATEDISINTMLDYVSDNNEGVTDEEYEQWYDLFSEDLADYSDDGEE